MIFKKGEFTDEAFKVIKRDIELMKDCRIDEEDFNYHYNLALGNLSDVFGKKFKVKSWTESMTDDELIKDGISLYESIDKSCCFSVNDCKRLILICKELNKRGVDF